MSDTNKRCLIIGETIYKKYKSDFDELAKKTGQQIVIAKTVTFEDADKFINRVGAE